MRAELELLLVELEALTDRVEVAVAGDHWEQTQAYMEQRQLVLDRLKGFVPDPHSADTDVRQRLQAIGQRDATLRAAVLKARRAALRAAGRQDVEQPYREAGFDPATVLSRRV